MSSSRIFVRGLPPTFSEADFRKHFSQKELTTDVKVFPNRRIGYVGYRTPEDAQKAVRYFDKTFIRMSRIGVELARPVEEAKGGQCDGKELRANKSSDESSLSAGKGINLKRKRDGRNEQDQDPKLKEFLEVMKPKSKRRAWESDGLQPVLENLDSRESEQFPTAKPDEDDDEYDQVLSAARPAKSRRTSETQGSKIRIDVESEKTLPQVEADDTKDSTQLLADSEVAMQNPMSDADWARSRTSRLLGLLDDEEETEEASAVAKSKDSDKFSDAASPDSRVSLEEPPNPDLPTSTPNHVDPATRDQQADADIETVRQSMRLFIRNLSYHVQQEDLEAAFAPFGNLEEVHVALDKNTGLAKGFAYVQFSDPDSAEQAFIGQDGQSFQGRLIHVIPAAARRTNKLDDFALSKLPLKRQQEIKRKREAANSTFNWNALYMNADAVVSSVADQLGLSKSQILDPTSSEAAVKQAHAETHVIQETKSYFQKYGVDLESFKRSQRGKTAILVKNIPPDCSKDELKRLFEEHGDIKKFLIPPSGTIAIVEFANAAQCKAAFGSLAYRKIKSSVLFLERAPENLFAFDEDAKRAEQSVEGVNKVSTTELKGADQDVLHGSSTATLFVRNLNFSTTSDQLTDTFGPLSGFLSGRVKTKTDPKRPGQTLSMGFGFVEFRTPQQAQAALHTMDGYNLAGHKLQVRVSNKSGDVAEEQKKAKAARMAAGQRTKVIVKNIPFETNKKDIRALLGAYGQLRSVRVPKKMDRAARGFAFAEFTTPKEAQSALDALRDTHLLGRRLVLDFADEEPNDAEAEIEKMQEKVGAQVNKIALRKLANGGRKKFTPHNQEEQD